MQAPRARGAESGARNTEPGTRKPAGEETTDDEDEDDDEDEGDRSPEHGARNPAGEETTDDEDEGDRNLEPGTDRISLKVAPAVPGFLAPAHGRPAPERRTDPRTYPGTSEPPEGHFVGL